MVKLQTVQIMVILFNPYYYEMKVNAFLLNKNNDISIQEMNVRTLRLHKLRVHGNDLPQMVWERVVKDMV